MDNGKETPGMGEMTEEGKLRQKEAEDKKKEIKTIISIGADPAGKVYVIAPLTNKKLCFKLLGEAVKIVAMSEEPVVIKPQNRFMNGIRNLRRH